MCGEEHCGEGACPRWGAKRPRHFKVKPHVKDLRLLRSRTGASPLATQARSQKIVDRELKRLGPEQHPPVRRVEHAWRKTEFAISRLSHRIAFQYFQGDFAAAALACDVLDFVQHLLTQPQPAKLRHHCHIVHVDQRPAGEGRKKPSKQLTSPAGSPPTNASTLKA